MSLAEKLVSLRKKKGLTQMDLAERLNVSRQAISRWEVGSSAPSTDNLRVLSEIYGVSIDYLVNSQENYIDKVVDSNEIEIEPVNSSDGKKQNNKRTKIFLFAVLISLSFALIAYITTGRFNGQNEPVPMENMNSDESSTSDVTFSFG